MKRPDKLLAEWFWTDRWMGSSAFLLPMEARGVYREMLTQAWRRGARLPNDHEAIQRAIGCTAEEWERAWPKLSRYWRVDGDDLVNDTQLEVYLEAKAAQDRASARGRKGAQATTQARAQALAQAPAQAPTQAVAQAPREHSLEHQPPSPSPSPSPSPEEQRTPPDPPADAGGNGSIPHGTSSERRARRAQLRDDADSLERYWIQLGGRPSADDRARIRDSLRSGSSVADLRRSIASRVHEDLVRAGALEPEAAWPPSGLEPVSDLQEAAS